MNNSQDSRKENAESARTIRIEMPASMFGEMRRMMAGFMPTGTPESKCCEPATPDCCQDSLKQDRCEFTVTFRRKE